MSCSKLERFKRDGEEWYYQIFVDDNGEVEAVRLYDQVGEFVKEFKDESKMMKFFEGRQKMKEGRGKGNQSGNQPEMQRVFMQRLERLQGDRKRYEFAEFLGISHAAYNNYLCGARFPTAAALLNIAERCGVTVDWLIREKPTIDFSGYSEDELRRTLESIADLISKYDRKE